MESWIFDQGSESSCSGAICGSVGRCTDRGCSNCNWASTCSTRKCKPTSKSLICVWCRAFFSNWNIRWSRISNSWRRHRSTVVMRAISWRCCVMTWSAAVRYRLNRIESSNPVGSWGHRPADCVHSVLYGISVEKYAPESCIDCWARLCVIRSIYYNYKMFSNCQALQPYHACYITLHHSITHHPTHNILNHSHPCTGPHYQITTVAGDTNNNCHSESLIIWRGMLREINI